MAERERSLFSIEELPSHLILGDFNFWLFECALDLVSLEKTCRTFGGSYGVYPCKFRSMAEFAAFQLCCMHSIFYSMPPSARKELLDRCDGNWKWVLRFLQSLEQASGMVETPAGNMQITTGKYDTLLINGDSVYSCGSSLFGVLGLGPVTTQCEALTRVSFPSKSHVIRVSACHNHAAFAMQSGEVFTCGDNSSFCCGRGEKGIPCKQVATGLNFTVILTKEGRVYTCGTNSQGQLGHGDTMDRPTPKLVQQFEGLGCVVQIAAGVNYTLAVTCDGTVYSFGSASNFCLGHGDQHNEFQPCAIQSFTRKNIHVICVSAGDEHAVALDSNGYVYTWGEGYCGALGQGDENDKTIPELLTSLKRHLAVQICARKRKTFVLMDNGSVFAFGWMGFGSLGFSDRGLSDKITKPRILANLKAHHISQISTDLYHTLAVTNRCLIFGFGDNERGQLGHGSLRGCLEPTEIVVQVTDEVDILVESG